MVRKLVGMNFHAPMIPMDTVVKFKLDTGEDYESTTTTTTTVLTSYLVCPITNSIYKPSGPVRIF